MEPRIYVACLASYNNGVLHGRWIDATSDVDEMRDEVNAMLRESQFPNVTIACPDCYGTGVATFRNVETKTDEPGPCDTCKGQGYYRSAEEFAIHDYEDLPQSFGEYTSLATIADFVSLTESESYVDAPVIAACVDEMCGDIDAARRMIEDDYCGVFESFRDYAHEFADEQLAQESLPSWITSYFDYEAYARDLASEMRVIDMGSRGVAVFYYA